MQGLSQKLRAAVTGGSGFIGSHVVDRLLAAGHEVVVVDVRPPHRSDVDFEYADVLDLEGLRHALQGCDVVFHLAGVANVNEAATDAARTVELNVTATARVWQAARDCAVRRAVLASTVWVYGAADGDGPVDEDALFDLRRVAHVYTASKIAAELVVRSCHELYGQEFTILRYGIPYGPRMRGELVIPRFVKAALSGTPIVVDGDGSQFRNYVYVEDMAEAHVRALGDAGANEVFNLEGSEPVTVRQLVDEATALAPSPVPVSFGDPRPGDYAGRTVSAQRARDRIGWQPETPFAEGLRRYVEWWRAGSPEPAGAARPNRPEPAWRRLVGRRVSPAVAGLVLPPLAVHGELAARATASAVLMVAGAAAAWLSARWSPWRAPRPVAALLALLGVWFLSQAEGPGLTAAVVVLGVGVGMCARLSWRLPLPAVVAIAGVVLGARILVSPTPSWWLGAAAMAGATLEPISGLRQGSWRPTLPAVSSFVVVTVLAVGSTALVGATSAEAWWFAPPVRHASRHSPMVALTFDTDSIASAAMLSRRLDGQRVPATFFVPPAAVLADASFVPSVVARHQGVGVATRDRGLLAVFDPRSRSLVRDEEAFATAGSMCPTFVRRRDGYHSPLLARSADRRGMEVVGWDVSVDASREADPARLARRLLARASGGSILRIDLTHGGVEAEGRVSQALPLILDGLARRRLAAAPLDELLGRPPYLSECAPSEAR